MNVCHVWKREVSLGHFLVATAEGATVDELVAERHDLRVHTVL